MSTIELTNSWIERSSDWANPILVKETRQALKSRQFIITFMLLLAGSWVISTFGMLAAGDAIEFGSAAPEFFFAYYLVLAIAIFIVVPFGAYRSLLSEKDEHTFELLSITTLTPRQIVWGKLFSALVQLFIYYSAIAPFIAFTSLLEGFDLAQVTFLLVLSMLCSLAASMVALLLATMAKQKQWQALNSLVLLGGLLMLLSMSLTWTSATLSRPIPFDDPDFWWATGFSLAAGVSYFILFQQIITAQLTFESDNRSTGIRITGSVQFLLLWLGFLGYSWITGSLPSRGEVTAIAIFSAIHWSVVGLFVATEDNFLSRRVRRGLPKSVLLRLLFAPFMPGGSRGFLYVIVHLAVNLLFIAGVTTIWGAAWHAPVYGSWHSILLFVTCLSCYVIIYLGIGTALGRWGRQVSSECRPAHVRVITLLVFAAGLIVPYLPSVMGLVRWSGYTLFYVTNPFTSIWEVERGRSHVDVITEIVAAGALLAILVNLAAMRRGVTEILSAEAK